MHHCSVCVQPKEEMVSSLPGKPTRLERTDSSCAWLTEGARAKRGEGKGRGVPAAAAGEAGGPAAEAGRAATRHAVRRSL
jgi:hypothetical protein